MNHFFLGAGTFLCALYGQSVARSIIHDRDVSMVQSILVAIGTCLIVASQL